MTLQIFMLSVFASVLGAAIYVLVFSQYESRIRDYLKNKRNGWNRRRYVRVFVAAVRGESKAKNAGYIARLMLVFPVAMLILTHFQFATIKLYQSKAERLAGEIESFEDHGIEEQSTAIDELKRENTSLQGKIKNLLRQEVFFLSFYGVWLIYLAVFWYSDVVFRATFESELERFMSRIQYLASKAELAQLITHEMAVHDEDTAREFTEHLTKIARRYEISDLVKPFQLWDWANAQSVT